MAAKRPRKILFTVGEANAMLPLLRSILRDITTLAHDLRRRHDEIVQLQTDGEGDASRQEIIDERIRDFDRDQGKLQEYVTELENLGVELKDFFTGLVDFRCMMNGREVYLCWKQDEAEIEHWHELNTGFGGRKKLARNLVGN